MPSIWMDVDTAVTGIPVNIVALIDSTDFKSREESVSYDAAGMDLVWNFVQTDGTRTNTVITPTTGGNYNWSNEANGMYSIAMPASGGASANNDAEGFGWFTGFATGILPWTGPTIGFRAAGLNDKLIDWLYSPYRGLAGTALPNANADAAFGLPTSDAGGLDLDAQIKTAIDELVTGTPTTKYMGQFGPGVYVDSGAANTNTVTGTDGIVGTPVSTFAAARTIADAVGLNRYYVEGNSDITLAATHVDWEFCGVGSVADNVLNFGSQDVSRSRFCNLTLEGTQGGSGRIEAIECALQDPGAGATTLHIFALRCGLVDDVEIDTSNNNVFESCFSLVAGAGTPSIIATGAAGTLEIRHYSGGIELKGLSASHNLSIEGMGQVVFNANCSVNANVSIRGLFTITDNTAGMASLTQDAVVNMPKINAEADAALSDYGGPTNAEMEARTLAAADYFLFGSDIVATVNLVNTTTTNTDVAAVKAETALIVADTNELQTDWADGGRLDLILDGASAPTVSQIRAEMDSNSTQLALIVADTNELQQDNVPGLIGALNNLSEANVNAQMVDVYTVDTHALPGQVVMPATPTQEEMDIFKYKNLRNRHTQDASQWSLYADDGTTVDQKATVSNDGAITIKDEIEAGP